MTNSTPKFSNSRMERQGSPNQNVKQRVYHSGQRSPNYHLNSMTITNSKMIARTPIINYSGATPSRNNGRPPMGRQAFTPPCSAPKNISARSTPPRNESPRGSPSNGSFYAGAKFSEPPTPDRLPKPPSHWTGFMSTCSEEARDSCLMAQHFKMMLNIQA